MARLLEARFADRVMATMQLYRRFQMLVVTLAFVGANVMLAAKYPSSIPVLSFGAIAECVCLVCMYVLPKYGNNITAVQYAVFLGECVRELALARELKICDVGARGLPARRV
jgi:hypothetical protein